MADDVAGGSGSGGGPSGLLGSPTSADLETESLSAFVDRFERNLPQEMGADIRHNRYDGSFFKASML